MPDTATTAILAAALDYADRWGWLVVPLVPKGKNPIPKQWQKVATTEIDRIQGWWEDNPAANLGVKLGRLSNLIDIECDSPEAEKSLAALFGGEFPETATFSASRGKHRLFEWRGDLPDPDKAVFKVGGVEFRTGGGDKGAQSVFPPSIHPSGGEYKWILHPDQVGVARIPDEVVANVINAHAEGMGSFVTKQQANPNSARKALEADQVGEGGRDNALYAEACAMWREKTTLAGGSAADTPEVQGRIYRLIRALNLSICNPPLPDADIQRICESARRFVVSSIETDTARAGRQLTNLELEFRDGEWFPGNWSVELVETEPPTIRLLVPFCREPIEIGEMVKYDDPQCVHLAVLGATGTVCLADRPGFWTEIWNGRRGAKGRPATRGLKAKLLDSCKRVAGPVELKSGNMLAELAWSWMGDAHVFKGEPNNQQKSFKDEDGNLFFRFTRLYNELAFQVRDVNRNELSRVVRSAGAKDVWFGERRVRFMVLDKTGQAKMAEMANAK